MSVFVVYLGIRKEIFMMKILATLSLFFAFGAFAQMPIPFTAAVIIKLSARVTVLLLIQEVKVDQGTVTTRTSQLLFVQILQVK